MKKVCLIFIAVFIINAVVSAQPSTSEKTYGMEKYEGFYNYYLGDNQGKI